MPDYVATGDWLRSADRARHPVPGSPGQSAFPFGLTFVYAAGFLTWPLYAGAVQAVRARPELRGIAAAAGALLFTVAVLAEFGFTGNIRYATLPMALVCLLGGVGLPPLVRSLAPRWRTVLAVPAAIAVVVSIGIVVDGGGRLARDERQFGSGLDRALAHFGGVSAVRECGRVSTGPFERQHVAYALRLPAVEVFTHAVTPGIALQRSDRDFPGQQQLPLRARVRDWTIRARCDEKLDG